MKKYNVIVVGSDNLLIEAETEEQAITKAHEYMSEYGGLSDYTIDWASEASEYEVYSLHQDHDDLLRRIKEWGTNLDEIIHQMCACSEMGNCSALVKQSIKGFVDMVNSFTNEMKSINM